MGYFFFDTSALVKRYYPEPGTRIVDSLIENSEMDVVITSLSVIEMTSAFRRKHNRDDITRESLSGLLAAFFEKLSRFSSSRPTNHGSDGHSS